MAGELFRIVPRLGPEVYQTYAATAPLPTHWRAAGCAEAGCAAHEAGWRTVVDETTPLGREQAAWIRSECLDAAVPASPAAAGRRRYTETRENDLTVFTFPPGQTCFGDHQVPLERTPLFVVRGGDWRGNPLGIPTRTHVRPEDWVEDFAEHQQRVADALDHG